MAEKKKKPSKKVNELESISKSLNQISKSLDFIKNKKDHFGVYIAIFALVTSFVSIMIVGQESAPKVFHYSNNYPDRCFDEISNYGESLYLEFTNYGKTPSVIELNIKGDNIKLEDKTTHVEYNNSLLKRYALLPIDTGSRATEIIEIQVNNESNPHAEFTVYYSYDTFLFGFIPIKHRNNVKFAECDYEMTNLREYTWRLKNE